MGNFLATSEEIGRASKLVCDVNGLVISRTREKHATAWKDKRPIFWQKYSTEIVGFFILSFWNELHCTHLHWPQNKYENKVHRFSVQSEFIILYPFSSHCHPVKCILLIAHENHVYNKTLWAIYNYSCSHSYLVLLYIYIYVWNYWTYNRSCMTSKYFCWFV